MIKDYGDLWALTATAHPLGLVVTGHDLSFSSPGSGSPSGGAGPAGGVAGQSTSGTPLTSAPGAHHQLAFTPAATTTHHATLGTDVGGGPTSGAGPGSGTDIQTLTAGSGGEGRLPFTGFPALVTAGIGSGMSAVGGLLRRLSRPHRGR